MRILSSKLCHGWTRGDQVLAEPKIHIEEILAAASDSVARHTNASKTLILVTKSIELITIACQLGSILIC